MRPHWIAAFTVLAIAGCGGSGEPATHAEFVAQADKVCAEHNPKIDQAGTDVAAEAPLSEDEFHEFVEQRTDAFEALVDDLADLDRPENDAAVDRYLDRLERNVEGLRKALDEGTYTSDGFFSAVTNSSREANSLAEDAGLKVCSPLDQ